MDKIALKPRNVPRYTSYPTAVEFSEGVNSLQLGSWLEALKTSQTLSLYTHIPFCHQLCWFCGCHTKVVNGYSPVARYLSYLKKEIHCVGERTVEMPVVHLHLGGGSPTIVSADDFSTIVRSLRENFSFASDAEIAIEIDPRTVSGDKIAAYAKAGVTRASLGLQDFDVNVQRAINRVQSLEQVERVVGGLRRHGIETLNVDLVYGLPLQTVENLKTTLEKTLTLAPNRISLFGYAHVPKMKKHQNLIPLEHLPDEALRLELAEYAREYFLQRGFVEIGIDHFAQASDPLAVAASSGEMTRNFQGYTTDRADALIGLGVSAISTLPQGYAQNTTDMNTYAKTLDAGELPVARGVAITAEDQKYREIIMNLMSFMKTELAAVEFDRARHALTPFLETGEARYEGGVLYVEPSARSHLRLIASAFDQYLQAHDTRFSQAI